VRFHVKATFGGPVRAGGLPRRSGAGVIHPARPRRRKNAAACIGLPEPAIIKNTVNKRRSLTPNTGMPNVRPGAQSRRGGARQTVSDRVTFRSEAGQLREGWALNVSRGGLRAILDFDSGKVELGEEYVVTLGDPAAAGTDSSSPRKARIVWLQEEPDGFVVGVEYLSLSGTHPAAAPAATGQENASGSGAVDASGVSPAASAHSDLAAAAADPESEA
jgi:PilZ domain